MSQESRPATEHWRIEKQVARSSKGVVAAQNAKAAEVGCEILRAGGNAVDAAVATAFALAVVEPWMSGLGGCGYMMTYRADRAAVEAIDFSTMAPRKLDPSAFGLLEGAERDEDLFGWPRVVDDRNVHGPLSIGVPGSVAGLALASERHGRLPWKELLAPAIALARGGHAVDWWTTLKIAGEARTLKLYPAASDIWLPDGLPPVGTVEGRPHLDLGNLAQTLERLAEAGARDFYEGDIARDLLADLAEAGAWLSSDDLASYQAQPVTPLSVERAGTTINLLPGLNAGPTYLAALGSLPQFSAGRPDEKTFASYATALWSAYEARLAHMGHDGDFAGQGSTTHLSVADGEGNLVSLTNTLLSLFGSKILSPRTGVLMNNGTMWFDPRPGRPNSLAAGKRPLSNMCPMIATRSGQPWFALGASGGRRIMPAVFQYASFMIDLALEPAAAVHQPRINVDGGAFVEVDRRLGQGVLSAIGEHLPAKAVEALVTPNHFANPLLAGIEGGTCFGAAQVQSPVSAALEA